MCARFGKSKRGGGDAIVSFCRLYKPQELGCHQGVLDATDMVNFGMLNPSSAQYGLENLQESGSVGFEDQVSYTFHPQTVVYARAQYYGG